MVNILVLEVNLKSERPEAQFILW